MLILFYPNVFGIFVDFPILLLFQMEENKLHQLLHQKLIKLFFRYRIGQRTVVNSRAIHLIASFLYETFRERVSERLLAISAKLKVMDLGLAFSR